MKIRKITTVITAYIFIAVFILAAIFPYFWLITCSVRDENALFTIPPKLISFNNSFDNYVYVLTKTRIPEYLLNSVIISVTATIMCLFVSFPAGYAMARFSFKGKSTVSSSILLFKLLPQTTTLIPLYILMSKIKLMDTHFGLSFVHLFIMVPFSIWMSRGFFKTVPLSVEEAAQIDGCSKPVALLRIVIPITAPGLFAVTMYGFMLSWEEFIYAYSFTSSSAKPISVGIALFLGEAANLWGSVMASAVMMGLPVLIFFFLLQDNFIKGIIGGAVKG
jgi:multiple sugar transport system permease protein